MKFQIVKDKYLSGPMASIYLIKEVGEDITLYDEFQLDNLKDFQAEIDDIDERLYEIGHSLSAVITLFKDKEGIPGDGVCALFDMPNKNLRLYCIRYGSQIIVLGSGGPKSKSIKAFQEDEKLKDENYFLRWLSQQITEKIQKGEITFTNKGFDLDGNLEFEFK